MKRIVVLIDGTWDKEGVGADTNVAELDPENINIPKPFIKKCASGITQEIFYHDGVGIEGGLLRRVLGLGFGLGLKKIIQACYGFIVDSFEGGDEIYILGFSRGAYAARALAGMIGASGIQRHTGADGFEIAWSHYRVKPAVRNGTQPADSADRKTLDEFRSLSTIDAFHQDRRIKCVGVWDTVGSYGVPAGFGLTSLSRYITLLFLGFHDTSFGDHIDVGLHAVALDERRRPFVPTFWTIPKGKNQRGHVEQTWFSGAHANVGGSYPDARLSDVALIWMIARVQALTGLEFDVQAIRPPLRGASMARYTIHRFRVTTRYRNEVDTHISTNTRRTRNPRKSRCGCGSVRAMAYFCGAYRRRSSGTHIRESRYR